ncbi:MAG: biotin--[acetyl-CoA-carboxylase] ligase [Chloroflexota bacterium]|nr:biotin--[acetyl-CoA-carboxylase] ligase [Chloroflexota bacterium]
MNDLITPELIRAHVGPTQILREYRVFPEIGSTNTYLREEARHEAEGLVVVAEYQTAGRGRQGRSWVAPRGGSVHCSVLLRPPLLPPDLYLLTAACSLAVRDALAPLVTAPPQIKWPNDVLLEGCKVCGILTEVDLPHGESPRAVLGFGVNVHLAPPPDIAPNATCAAQHASRPVTRLDILAGTLRHYDALLAMLYNGGTDAVWQAWRMGLYTVGRRVRVRDTAAGSREGIALDVSRDGGLLLQTERGIPPQVIYAGDAIEDPHPAAS